MQRTEKAPGLGSAGFTLIEVLAAMVILAVGLLGLQGLAVGASRINTLSEKQSQYALSGSSIMEAARRRAREGMTASRDVQYNFALSGRDTALVRERITLQQGNRAQIIVDVSPKSSEAGRVRPGTLTLTSYVWTPALPATVP